MKKYKVRITPPTKQMGGIMLDDKNFKYGGQNTNLGLNVGINYDSNNVPNPYNVTNTIQPVPIDQSNVEAEKGETVVGDLDKDGMAEHFTIGGKRHSQGGTPLNLPQDAFIYSDTAKMKIKDPDLLALFNKSKTSTPADLAKQYDLNKYKAIIDNPNSDPLARSTAEKMMADNQKKLAQLAIIQEAQKGFKNGIPSIALPLLQGNNQSQQEQPQAPVQVAKYGGKMQDGGYPNYGNLFNYLPSQDPNMMHVSNNGNLATNWNDVQMTRAWKDLGYSPTSGTSSGEYLQQNYPWKVQDTLNSLGSPKESTSPNPLGNSIQLRHQQAVTLNKVPYLDPTGVSVPSDTNQPLQEVAPNSYTPASNNLVPPNNAVNTKVPFDYLLPDKLNMLNAAYNQVTIKKYQPYVAPIIGVTPETTYYDPSREIAATQSVIGSQLQANNLLRGDSTNRANSASLQGQGLEQIANTIGKYNNLNVGLANQASSTNANIANQLSQAQGNRATQLYNESVTGAQQYDNTTREARGQFLGSFDNAWKNRQNLGILNNQNPNYFIDPTSGRMVYKPGALNLSGNSSAPATSVEAKLKRYNELKTLFTSSMGAEAAHKEALRESGFYGSETDKYDKQGNPIGKSVRGNSDGLKSGNAYMNNYSPLNQ